MRLPLLLAALAVPAPTLAQNTPPPVTREQAMTLPPDQLADMVLRQLGARVTSVTRPGPGSLQRLVLATAPRATDVVGLCAATRIEVDAEAGPGNVRAVEVFRVVGELEPYAEVSEARAAEEDRRCAGAGPVIPADRNDRGRAFFFDYSGPVDRVTALLVLQRAIVEARDERYRNVGCGPAAAVCADPPAILGALDLANLVTVTAAPSGAGGLHRIGAHFLIEGDARARNYWTVTVEADLSDPDGLIDSIRSLGRTELARVTVVSAGTP